jgi:hypothetical protein
MAKAQTQAIAGAREPQAKKLVRRCKRVFKKKN